MKEPTKKVLKNHRKIFLLQILQAFTRINAIFNTSPVPKLQLNTPIEKFILKVVLLINLLFQNEDTWKGVSNFSVGHQVYTNSGVLADRVVSRSLGG